MGFNIIAPYMEFLHLNWYIAEWNVSENHRTQTQYDDALIIKLFAFQFANCYSTPFYIAFFRDVSHYSASLYIVIHDLKIGTLTLPLWSSVFSLLPSQRRFIF